MSGEKSIKSGRIVSTLTSDKQFECRSPSSAFDTTISCMSLAMMLRCICFLRCVTHSYLSLLDVDKFCATRANEPCRVEHLACGDSHLGSLRCVYAVDSQWLNSVCVPTCLVNLSYDAGASTSSLSHSEIARAIQPDLSSCTNCSYNVSQRYPLTAEQKERTANVTAQQELRVATVNSTVRYRLQTIEVTACVQVTITDLAFLLRGMPKTRYELTWSVNN